MYDDWHNSINFAPTKSERSTLAHIIEAIIIQFLFFSVLWIQVHYIRIHLAVLDEDPY